MSDKFQTPAVSLTSCPVSYCISLGTFPHQYNKNNSDNFMSLGIFVRIELGNLCKAFSKMLI